MSPGFTRDSDEAHATTAAMQSDAPPIAKTAEPRAAGKEAEQHAGRRTVAWRFAVVLALVLLDLWSKSAVFAWLESSDELVYGTCENIQHGRMLVLGDDVHWFSFMLSRNRGAAFGRFADWPWLLVAGRVLAVGFLMWFVARTPARRKVFAGALVLVLSGALGNLYDNLALAHFVEVPGGGTRLEFGWVRDFIDVYFSVWEYHFPTFNVADSCITVGAILLLLTGFVHAREEEPGERVPIAPTDA